MLIARAMRLTLIVLCEQVFQYGKIFYNVVIEELQSSLNVSKVTKFDAE